MAANVSFVKGESALGTSEPTLLPTSFSGRVNVLRSFDRRFRRGGLDLVLAVRLEAERFAGFFVALERLALALRADVEDEDRLEDLRSIFVLCIACAFFYSAHEIFFTTGTEIFHRLSNFQKLKRFKVTTGLCACVNHAFQRDQMLFGSFSRFVKTQGSTPAHPGL